MGFLGPKLILVETWNLLVVLLENNLKFILPISGQVSEL